MSVLFFDHCVGKSIPEALRRLNPPARIKYWQKQFRRTTEHRGDKHWIPIVARQGWIIISFDSKFREREAELRAMVDSSAGCFCYWGGNATTWVRFKLLARTLDRVLQLANSTPRPFLFRVDRRGRIRQLQLPPAAELRGAPPQVAAEHDNCYFLKDSRTPGSNTCSP